MNTHGAVSQSKRLQAALKPVGHFEPVNLGLLMPTTTTGQIYGLDIEGAHVFKVHKSFEGHRLITANRIALVE